MDFVHERKPLLSELSLQNIEFIVTKSLLRGLGLENSNLFISVVANTMKVEENLLNIFLFNQIGIVIFILQQQTL
jgi:hypothetical protein